MYAAPAEEYLDIQKKQHVVFKQWHQMCVIIAHDGMDHPHGSRHIVNPSPEQGFLVSFYEDDMLPLFLR